MGGYSSSSWSSSHGHLLKLIVLVALLTISPISAASDGGNAGAGFYWKMIHVHVENDISPKTKMTLHCKSKDDDLGVQYLNYQQSFDWKFRINFWKTTLYFCYIGWYESDGRIVQGTFDIYTAKRDRFRCDTQCFRSVRKEGIFSSSASKEFELMYSWPKKANSNSTH